MLHRFTGKGRMLFALVLVLILTVCLPLGVSAATAEGDSNGPCPTYSFDGMNGNKVTNADSQGKTTLLIFFNKADSTSMSNIKALAEAEWIGNSNLSVVAVEMYNATAAELQSFAASYGNNGKNITFCSTSSSVLWYFLNAAEYNQNSVAIPVSFIVDKSGNIRHYMTGRISEQSYRQALVGYVDGLTMPSKATVSISGTYDYSEAFDVLELVNKERAANGAGPLTMNSTLLEAAMLRAAECSTYFSHTRPNGEACSTVVSFTYFGENIAAGYSNAAAAVEGWMNSTGHRANILNASYDAIGVGVFYQDGIAYWVQLFSKNCGTPTASEKADKQTTATFDILDSYVNLKVGASSQTMEVGQTQNLQVYLQNEEFYNYAVRVEPSCVKYSSTDTSVVSVDSKGVITAVGGGSAEVKATLSGSKKSASYAVTVNAPALAAPKLTSAASVTAGVKLTWSPVTGAEKYEILLKTSDGWQSVGTTTAANFTYTGAQSGSSYTLTVRCVDGSGAPASDYDTTGKTLTYLATPKATKVENTATGVKITWAKVTGAQKYGVYVRSGSSGWKGIGTATGNTFTYTKGVSGTKYYFTIRCLDPNTNAGVSSFHSTGWGITYVAQPKVTKLESTASGVKVTWGAVNGAEKYRVYVKTVGGSWTNIGTTTSTSLTYTGAKNGTKYYFTVRCLNAAGNAFTSSFHPTGWSITYTSNLATPKVTKLENTASGVKVTWGKVTGAEKYRVYVKTVGGSWTNIGTTTATSFTYTGAKSGTKYIFTVRCLNAAGNAFTSSFNATGWGITYVAQPKVTALESTSSGVKVTWGAVTGAEKYRVYVKTEGGSWVNIGTTTSTSFTYTGAKAGTKYIFTVRCLNAAENAFTSSFNTAGWSTTYTG